MGFVLRVLDFGCRAYGHNGMREEKLRLAA